jgi:hypothetical protein
MTTVLLAINSSTWQATPDPLKASSAKQKAGLSAQHPEPRAGRHARAGCSDAVTCMRVTLLRHAPGRDKPSSLQAGGSMVGGDVVLCLGRPTFRPGRFSSSRPGRSSHTTSLRVVVLLKSCGCPYVREANQPIVAGPGYRYPHSDAPSTEGASRARHDRFTPYPACVPDERPHDHVSRLNAGPWK